MPRRKRVCTGGYVFHVLNRAVARERIFDDEGDYKAFEKVLREAIERVRARVLSFCLMPNHWHMVLWPRRGEYEDLSEFMRWLTVTHTQRWHAHHGTAGTGSLYQGRFKSFPVQGDEHFLTVCRYTERNALRANLVARAQDWRWSSLWHRTQTPLILPLTDWPVPCPAQWNEFVNQPETEAELAAVRQTLKRGSPCGDKNWISQTAERLGLESTLAPRGRPPR